MGRFTRTVLIRLAPLLWVAGIALTLIHALTHHRMADGYNMAEIMMLAFLAMTGTLCWAIREMGDKLGGDPVRMLRLLNGALDGALDATRRSPAEDYPPLQAVEAPLRSGAAAARDARG